MPHNTGINPSFPETPLSHKFQQRVEMLSQIGEGPVGSALADFDAETERLIREVFGKDANNRLEAYRYATMAEAESVVNMPESAQEESAQDLPKKAIQQRRQVLEGIVSELQAGEAQEEVALTGEDREDPPMMS